MSMCGMWKAIRPMIFSLIAARHQWAPGALEIAEAQSAQPEAQRTYAMLAAELVLPLRPGQRERKPVASTIKRRDHAQIRRDAAARRKIEAMRDEVRE